MGAGQVWCRGKEIAGSFKCALYTSETCIYSYLRILWLTTLVKSDCKKYEWKRRVSQPVNQETWCEICGPTSTRRSHSSVTEMSIMKLVHRGKSGGRPAPTARVGKARGSGQGRDGRRGGVGQASYRSLLQGRARCGYENKVKEMLFQ